MPPPIPPRKTLEPAQVESARAGFARGLSRDDVARLIGITRSTLEARLRDQLRDCRPGRGRGGHRPPTADPSPAEIAAMTAEIRAGWPESRWLPEPREEKSFAGLLQR
jgi:hypothetical protein